MNFFFVGVIAQLVEQRTENPCVPGSIPGDTTERSKALMRALLFSFYTFSYHKNAHFIEIVKSGFLR